MEQLNSRYYERFLQFFVETNANNFKHVKRGHCMKITGLAMRELRVLLPLVRPLNKDLSVYILSESDNGDEYIHASKLIELRNDPDKSVLILVPSNSRTSAEDSYGDATFQNISASALQEPFYQNLVRDIPAEDEIVWSQIKELVESVQETTLQQRIVTVKK